MTLDHTYKCDSCGDRQPQKDVEDRPLRWYSVDFIGDRYSNGSGDSAVGDYCSASCLERAARRAAANA